jgi:predicted lipoprotein with Yx(FWY)xxD motif
MRGRLITVAIGGCGLIAACSSTTHTGTGNSVSTSAPTVVISVHGGHLTGADGKTLYYNTVDTASSISCTGGCATAWPPVLGTPSAGAGVNASNLGTATRPEGATQVTYDGHPLYEYTGDTSTSSTSGSGMADAGGHWVVATTNPSSATTPTPSTSSSASGGYGGYGY